MNTTATNLKKKDYIKFRDDIFQVSTVEFYHPGKGRTVVRTFLKGITKEKNLAQVFTSNDDVEVLEVNAVPVQYLFGDSAMLHFMHDQTFEEYEVARDLVGVTADFLKEGQAMYVLMLDDKAVGIRPPMSVTLIVTEADMADRGDTATNAKKQVTLETGVKVMVPLFIKKGEKIKINPEDGSYSGRENS